MGSRNPVHGAGQHIRAINSLQAKNAFRYTNPMSTPCGSHECNSSIGCCLLEHSLIVSEFISRMLQKPKNRIMFSKQLRKGMINWKLFMPQTRLCVPTAVEYFQVRKTLLLLIHARNWLLE